MIAPTPLELHTPRLLLRDFVEDDWTAIFAMSQETAVIEFQEWLRLDDEEAARRWVLEAMHHNRLQPRSGYNLAITHRKSGQVIGWPGWGQAEAAESGVFDFGYALLPDVWGQGYMSEALKAAVTLLFDSLSANAVYGECPARNRASVRVMKKAGLRLEAEWSDMDKESGETVAMHRHATTRAEYLADK